MFEKIQYSIHGAKWQCARYFTFSLFIYKTKIGRRIKINGLDSYKVLIRKKSFLGHFVPVELIISGTFFFVLDWYWETKKRLETQFSVSLLWHQDSKLLRNLETWILVNSSNQETEKNDFYSCSFEISCQKLYFCFTVSKRKLVVFARFETRNRNNLVFVT